MELGNLSLMKNELDEKKKKKEKRKNVVIRLGPIPNESSQAEQALSQTHRLLVRLTLGLIHDEPSSKLAFGQK